MAEPTVPTRTALVTGAAGHIGRELLRLLTAAGFTVVGVDRPGVARPPHAAGWVTLDLAAPDVGDRLTARLQEQAPALCERLDLVVHAAGVTAIGRFEVVDDRAFTAVMDVNHHAAVRVTRSTLAPLHAAGGHVVVLSSLAGVIPAAGRSAYVGAKHAVTGTFRALATELEPVGIGVSVLHPAFLRTPVTEVGPGEERTTTGPALEAVDVARAVAREVARRARRGRGNDRLVVGWAARAIDGLHRVAPRWTVRAGARRLGR